MRKKKRTRTRRGAKVKSGSSFPNLRGNGVDILVDLACGLPFPQSDIYILLCIKICNIGF